MSQQKAIVDKLLTNVSSAYRPDGYVADMFLPTARSMQKTGKLGILGKDHLRIESSIIGGDGAYPRVKSVVRSTDSYSIEGHGLHDIVTEDDYSNVELPFDAENEKTLGLTTKLALEKEYSLANALSDTAILTQNTTLAGSSQFSDYLNSDPISVFATARAAVKAGCGVPADTAIIPWEVINKIKYHPQFLASLGYKDKRPGGLNYQEIADLLEVKRLLVPTCMYNSAKEGQTASLSAVWGKHIILAVAPQSAQKEQVSLGYNMVLIGRERRRVFKSPVSNPPNATQVLVDDHYDHFLSNVLAGYLIKNSIA